MERNLLWISFALGWAGWLLAVLLAGDSRATRARWLPCGHLIAAICLPIAVFLFTLPSAAPWAAGQGLGRGFLLGAVCALLGYWVSFRATESRNLLSAATAITAPLFLALVAAAGSLIWLRAEIIDTLMGVAIGWLCEALLVIIGESVDAANQEPRTRTTPRTILAGTGFAVTLCATAALGVYRGQAAFESYSWAAAAIAMGAIVPLAALLAGIPAPFVAGLALKLPLASMIARITGRVANDDASRRLAAGAWRIAITAGLLLFAGWLLSVKAVTEAHLFHSVSLGIGVGLLLWWLEPEAGERGGWPGAMRALVVLGGFMIAYRLLAGFGLGLALTAAWAVAALTENTSDRSDSSDGSNRVVVPLLFGTILLLYRLFSTRFAHELRGVSLDDHYALFALILGAALPEVVGALQVGRIGQIGPIRPGWSLLRLALCGVILLAVPALLTLLWGSKCALGLMFGLALSVALSSGRTERESRAAALAPLFALAMALALIQWMRHAMPLASLARADKIRILEWSVGGVVVVLILADYAGRLFGRGRPAPAASGGAGK